MVVRCSRVLFFPRGDARAREADQPDHAARDAGAAALEAADDEADRRAAGRVLGQQVGRARQRRGLLDELSWRGMLHTTTPGLPARLAR